MKTSGTEQSPKINTHIYGQLMHKDIKTIQWGKNSLFNKWCSVNRTSTCKRFELDPSPAPYTKLTQNRSNI